VVDNEGTTVVGQGRLYLATIDALAFAPPGPDQEGAGHSKCCHRSVCKLCKLQYNYKA
jgi:hypothetical protein